jgi:hypothetical protein
MAHVRWVHSEVALQDGRVLVVGGRPSGESATLAEVFDPAAGTWKLSATPSPTGHDWPVVAPLCDGRVLVGGRVDANTHDAEIYDPAKDTWAPVPKGMKFSHIYGTATLLADCRVLLAGGYSANTHAEIYDPVKNGFSSVGAMNNERFFHSATLLADGRVLVAGGGVDVNGTWITRTSVDIFDPKTLQWTKAKPMHGARRAHTATRLLDGRVLVAGGTNGGAANGDEAGNQLDSAEIYDPIADAWTKLPPLGTPRTFHTAALLPSGAVLLFGGVDATGSATSKVEGFLGGEWHPLPPLLDDRYLHASAQLADGSVLVTGGVLQASAEIYGLAGLGETCASDIECAGGHCTGGLCCNEACDTGCRRCDVPGKEGTCCTPCADESHALVCADGGTTCSNDACQQASCGAFRCAADSGACKVGCSSVEDCAPGYACDLAGACVAPPDVSADDGDGCGVPARPGREPLRGSALAVSALVAALAAARKRRRR